MTDKFDEIMEIRHEHYMSLPNHFGNSIERLCEKQQREITDMNKTMTDKERIEIYVNELPKSCENCPCLEINLSNCNITKNCVIHECACNMRAEDCPLKTIQSIQNAKAVEALEKVKERIYGECSFDYSLYLRIKNYIDQLIKEHGGENE